MLITQNLQLHTPSFKGFKKIGNLETQLNQYKILLTQDIFSNSLKVKLPETDVEKKALLEVLRHRLHLDYLTELTNKRFKLMAKIEEATNLSKENPSSSELKEIQTEFGKLGDLKTVLSSYNSKISSEIQKHEESLEYFKDIEKLEEEYREKKLVKNSMMAKFWDKIVKNNINPDGELSTKELIDIVQNSELNANKAEKAAKPVKKVLSKKQLLDMIPVKYEKMLREDINIYEGGTINTTPARTEIKGLFADTISTLPDIEKQITKTFNKVDLKYMNKARKLNEADCKLHNINILWKYMKELEISLKGILKDIEALKLEAEKSNSKQAQKELKNKEKYTNKFKKAWLKSLKASVEFENKNRENIAKAGKLSEYSYLIDANKTFKKYKTAYEFLNDNKKNLPDSFWTDIVSKDI